MAETKGLWPALLAVQAEAPKLLKTAENTYHSSKYVPLDEVQEAIKPLLAKHGLLWHTKPSSDANGNATLKYKMLHVESGEVDEDAMPLFVRKESPQEQGSAITYARRYALVAYLDLIVDQDDDGNKASGATKKRAPSKPKAAPSSPALGDFLLPGNDKPLKGDA